MPQLCQHAQKLLDNTTATGVYSPPIPQAKLSNRKQEMNTLTAREVAERLQASRDTVERLIKRGELYAERLTPRGRFRISEESLLDYAKRQRLTLQPPQPPA